MKKVFLFLLALQIVSCTAQEKTSTNNIEDSVEIVVKNNLVTEFYNNHVNDSLKSISVGSVSKGSIKNATLLPFSGKNFMYFDTTSYLSGRAFSTEKTINAVINSYRELEDLDRTFMIMELSNEHGGKMFPHRTHQNGLSVDLMVPLIKDGKPYTELDHDGVTHYLLDFDNSGRLSKDTSVQIDFNLIARHLLALNETAKEQGLKIEKVIINTDLKDELFNTHYGKKLKTSGIYIVRNLEPIINDLHDDHYHVDFGQL